MSAEATGAEALFAAVYAAPDDDGPRAVLADFLQERGDPRGDFIALQLAAPRTRDAARRMHALTRTHGDGWLGRLSSLLAVREVGWERGFPVRARFLVKRPSEARRLADLPELATLRALRLGSLARVGGDELCARVLLQPSLRRVRELADVPVAILPALIDARPPLAPARIELLDGGPPAMSAWLFATPFGRGLEALSIGSDALAEWLAALVRLDPRARLQTFVARCDAWTATLTRAPDGAWSTLTIAVDGWGDSERAAADALGALPPGSLREVELDAPWRTPELAAAIARATGTPDR